MSTHRAYRVVWSRQASQALAAIWSGADRVMRHDITAAQNLLDRDLTTPRPENIGHAVSRWSSLARHTTRYPLKIWFLIDAHNYEVVVKKVELDVPPLFPPVRRP